MTTLEFIGRIFKYIGLPWLSFPPRFTKIGWSVFAWSCLLTNNKGNAGENVTSLVEASEDNINQQQIHTAVGNTTSRNGQKVIDVAIPHRSVTGKLYPFHHDTRAKPSVHK